jgi:hypothetical protein
MTELVYADEVGLYYANDLQNEISGEWETRGKFISNIYRNKI